ncbi:LysE family translocator [Vibrio sp. WXL103]|uniref:LysE family translocator n=1 Tax=Vibrio sp. WXL103 TaxID=3450710 RepID=UPI003EC91B82
MTPGLDTALVIRNTTRGGLNDGVLTSLGICLGLYVHATLSALGISVVLTQSAQLFYLIKTLGAGYLIYLGITSLRSMTQSHTVKVDSVGSQSLSVKRSLREGFLSNVLNPKTGVFYLAFLPQFINPEYSAFSQSLLMASIHFVIAMVWQCGLSAMLTSAKSLLSNAKFIAWMEGTTGAVLVVLGIKLLLEKAPV